MHLDKNSSWIIKTNQMWKIRIFSVLGVIDFILLILMIWNINNPQNELVVRLGIHQIHFRAAFLILGLMTLAALFLLIRCPNCKKRPVYFMIRKTNVNEWYSTLINLKQCPICKESGGIKSTPYIDKINE